MKYIYKLNNLDCPRCANKIECMLNNHKDINKAIVNFSKLELVVETDIGGNVKDIVSKIKSVTDKRKSITKRATNELLKTPNIDTDKVFIMNTTKHPGGVLRIIADKATEILNKPTIVITLPFLFSLKALTIFSTASGVCA